MENRIKNIIGIIEDFAKKETSLVKQITRMIPHAKNLKVWSSYDTLENVETKEIHIKFSVIGTSFHVYTRSDGKIWLENDKEKYISSYWWSARYGGYVSSTKTDMTELESAVHEKLSKALYRCSEAWTPKFRIPEDFKYGKYEVYTVNATAYCKDSISGKITYVRHNPFGERIIGADFPPEILNLINRNFLRLR